MQSPVATMCRVLVLLVFLVAVPLAALFGSSLPELAKTLLKGHRAPGAESAPQWHGEPPRFVSGGAVPCLHSRPDGPLAAQSPSTSATDRVQAASALAIHADGDVRPISAEVAATSKLAFPIHQAGGLEALTTDETTDRTGGREESGRSRLDELSPFAEPAAVDPAVESSRRSLAASGRSDPSVEPCRIPALAGHEREATAFKQRLRELGVNSYALEPWGSQGQLYRFHCTASIGGHANWSRYFEATSVDAVNAMREVVEEIQRWRVSQPFCSTD